MSPLVVAALFVTVVLAGAGAPAALAALALLALMGGALLGASRPHRRP